MNTGTLLFINAAAAWFMTGLIWLIQVVHYPLFARVGAAGYRDYQLAHQELITLVVGPVMLVEAMVAGALVLSRRDAWTMTAAILLVLIWASTAFLQVPMHEILNDGFNAEAHTRLVQTNWIRTIGWTARGVIALYLIRTSA